MKTTNIPTEFTTATGIEQELLFKIRVADEEIKNLYTIVQDHNKRLIEQNKKLVDQNTLLSNMVKQFGRVAHSVEQLQESI